jgi:hypothetical protein
MEKIKKALKLGGFIVSLLVIAFTIIIFSSNLIKYGKASSTGLFEVDLIGTENITLINGEKQYELSINKLTAQDLSSNVVVMVVDDSGNPIESSSLILQKLQFSALAMIISIVLTLALVFISIRKEYFIYSDDDLEEDTESDSEDELAEDANSDSGDKLEDNEVASDLESEN